MDPELLSSDLLAALDGISHSLYYILYITCFASARQLACQAAAEPRTGYE